MQNNIIKRLITGVFVLIWMATVFIFSSQDGTQTLNTSGAFIHAIEETIKKEDTQVESNNQAETDKVNTQEKYKYSDEVQKFVRKNAHYFLYTVGGFIISVFFYVNLKDSKNYICKGKIKCNKCIFYAILLGFIYAISDEVHQLFVIGRTSSPRDVLIDTLGVITGTILFKFILYMIDEKKKILKLGE